MAAVAGISGLGALSLGGGARSTPDLPPTPTNETDSTSSERSPDAEYYVAPDGDDSARGSRNSPFETLEAAIDVVEPNETITIGRGIYHRQQPIAIDGLAGTADGPIVIRGESRPQTIFSFDGPYPGGWEYEGGFVFRNVQNLVVENLSVQYSPHFGIKITGESTDNLFQNISTTFNNLSGLGIHRAGAGNTLRNVLAAHNYDRQNGGANGDGIQLSNTNDCQIFGAKTYGNSDDGIDLWGSNHIRVVGCVSWNNGHSESGDGSGFKLGGSGASAGGHHVHRNAAFGNSGQGFTHNGSSVPVEMFNNTAWNNPINYSFYKVEHDLVNNISHLGKQRLGPTVNDRHNTWNLDITDPRFASKDVTDDRFLHLARGSPCIDAGTVVDEIEYNRSAPDLGAYEYQQDGSNDGTGTPGTHPPNGSGG